MLLISDFVNYPSINIQVTIQLAQMLVDHYIRTPLKIPTSIPRKELLKKARRDLENNLKYIIDFPDMPRFDNKFIPAIQKVNGGNRKNGGVIRINRNLNDLAKNEGLLHEYVHVRVPDLPIHTTNKNTANYWLNSQPYNLIITELLAEFLFLNLWLPKKEIIDELKLRNFNINKFIGLYTDVKKSTLLQWIALICPFACHFAWVVIPKDDRGNLYYPNICDMCRYDKNKNPQPFQFNSVLGNPLSIAAQALASRRSKSGESILDGNEYRCYAYYEKDLLRSQSNDYFPDLNCERYDQLLVVGWDKSEFTQYLSTLP